MKTQEKKREEKKGEERINIILATILYLGEMLLSLLLKVESERRLKSALEKIAELKAGLIKHERRAWQN